jgi:hypothetical protein
MYDSKVAFSLVGTRLSFSSSTFFNSANVLSVHSLYFIIFFRSNRKKGKLLSIQHGMNLLNAAILPDSFAHLFLDLGSSGAELEFTTIDVTAQIMCRKRFQFQFNA